MRLAVLGRHGIYPPQGGACSGFYVETAAGRGILMDCGPGVLSRMNAAMLQNLDTVVLTHLHWDHISDALPLCYALERAGRKITLYLPNEPESVAALFAVSSAITPAYISDGQSIDYSGCNLRFIRMRHPLPTYGVRICEGDTLLVYSGDSNACEGVMRLLEGSPNLALLDSCFSDTQWTEEKPHLSARLAARAMKEADVQRPLLTHLPPGEDDMLLLSQAREVCPNVEWAQEGEIYLL